ncbi:MAG: LPXTG cell wall anchor domain-containing protein [Ruminococcus sp.]|nr:LPXTG cell wall anchor domain-containing protein [Ruminococcus sp.]
MLYDIIMLAESVPATGDDFPAKKLIFVGAAALAAMIGAALLARKKGDDDKDE